MWSSKASVPHRLTGRNRTKNRSALFLELLFGLAQFRTKNRSALFLELL